MLLKERFLPLVLILILLSSVFPLLATPAPAEAAAWVTMDSGTTESLYSVWGSSCNNVYAVGYNGTLLHYNGNSWSTVDTGISEGLQGIWGSSANNIFAVGWSGTILHFDGTSWTAMTSGSTRDLYAVWGNAANSVFAVGGMQVILYWNGTTWSKMTTPEFESAFLAIWGTAYNNVYVVGSAGDIYHFNGTAWSQMTSDTSNDLHGIWGSSASDIWAGGILQSSRVHYNGSAWSGGGMPNLEYYNGFWGTSSSNVYSAGYSMMGAGSIRLYNGSSWLGVTIPTCGQLNGIWGSSGSDIFAVGDDGTILHYGGCPGGPTSAVLDTTLGTVNLNIDAGFITNAVWVPSGNMRCSAPSDCIFPYGMFTFDASGISASQPGVLSIRFPNPIPLTASYFNCTGGNMVNISSWVTRVNEYNLRVSLPASSTYTLGVCFAQSIPQSSSPWTPTTSGTPMNLSNISVKSASLSATKVTPGTPVTVTANVANTGTGNGSSVIRVYVNGAEDAQQGVSVNSGSTTIVSFDVSRNEPGTYTVYVGGTQAGSFTVDQFTPDTILFISGSLVFFALILGVVLMTSRRRA